MLWKVEEGAHTDCADDADFFFAFFVPQISQINTDLCPMRAGTAGGKGEP